MIRIITDTSTLYSPEEGKKLGIDVNALAVAAGGKNYIEFVDMFPAEFVEIVRAGNVPQSSQPPVGGVIENYEKYPEDDIINICMADGLSGTYQSALGAKEGLANADRIHVINSATLCGPHRYFVQETIKNVQAGLSLEEVLEKLDYQIKHTRSFLMPQDFDFLRRGGRLTPLAAKALGLLKVQPIMTQTDDGRRLESFGMGRTFMGAVKKLVSEFEKLEGHENYRVYISHADVLDQAEKVKEMFLKSMPNLHVEILDLSPAFITQGGPSCVAVQWTINV